MQSMQAMQQKMAALEEENRQLKAGQQQAALLGKQQAGEQEAGQGDPTSPLESQLMQLQSTRCFPARRERATNSTAAYAAFQIARLDADARARAAEVKIRMQYILGHGNIICYTPALDHTHITPTCVWLCMATHHDHVCTRVHTHTSHGPLIGTY